MKKKSFYNIRIFTLGFGAFKRGAAMTIPGVGIFVGKQGYDNKALLMHEYGHILQYRMWGFWFYWFRIAPVSLKSAYLASKKGIIHQHSWTEWSANRLSYFYFNQPADWNQRFFPIEPPTFQSHLHVNKYSLALLKQDSDHYFKA